MLVRGASGGFWLLLHGSWNENSLLEALRSQLITNKCVFLAVRSLPADSGLCGLFAFYTTHRCVEFLSGQSNFGCLSNHSCSLKSADTLFTFLDLNLLNLLKRTHSGDITIHSFYIMNDKFIIWWLNKKWMRKSPLANAPWSSFVPTRYLFHLNYEQSSCCVPMDRGWCST